VRSKPRSRSAGGDGSCVGSGAAGWGAAGAGAAGAGTAGAGAGALLVPVPVGTGDVVPVAGRVRAAGRRNGPGSARTSRMGASAPPLRGAATLGAAPPLSPLLSLHCRIASPEANARTAAIAISAMRTAHALLSHDSTRFASKSEAVWTRTLYDAPTGSEGAGARR
jgi:hypothetical protein